MKHVAPDFSFEQPLWQQGFSWVIGVDEVGRGAFAGPVVAGVAAVKRSARCDVEYSDIGKLGIDDSKRLTSKKREALIAQIHHYFHCAIGEATVAEINRDGIVAATHRAMRRAITGMLSFVGGGHQNVPCFLLVDGNVCPRVLGFTHRTKQAIIKGDQKSLSIAAASIIAKVYRDEIMIRLAKEHPVYRWEKNKGYGTDCHRQALRHHGSTPLHRTLFVRSSVSISPEAETPQRFPPNPAGTQDKVLDRYDMMS